MAYHTFEGYIDLWTQKAVRFRSYYWDDAVWFPISQSIIEPDGDGTWVIRVRDWLCKKNGIEEFMPYDEAKMAEFNDF